MGLDPFTEDARRLIVGLRERERYRRSQPLSDYAKAVLGVTYRRWIPNPRYMTPGEPVGHWETVERASTPVRGADGSTR